MKELRADELDRVEALAALRVDLATRMRLTASLGLSWSEIADDLGMSSAEAARSWAKHHAPPPAPSPGCSVAEAARRLGVSRPTVYARIRAGQLDTVLDGQGRTRVLL